jgi:fucose permease
MLFIFYRVGYMSGSLAGGRVIDRLRGNRLTGFVLLFIAAMLALLPFANSLFLLFGSVLFLGLGMGVAEVAGQTGIIRLHGAGVGPYMNGLHLSYCAGAIISPLIISAFLYYRAPVYAAFRLMAGLAALTGCITLTLKSSGAFTKDEAAPVKAPAFLVAFFAAALMLTGAAESSFSGWLYSYALHSGLADEGLSGILTSAFWLAMTCGRLLGVYLVGRFGSLRLLFVTSLGAVFSLSGLLFFPPALGGLWLSTILCGVFQASVVPLLFTLAGERRIVSGAVAGIFVAATSLGGMVFPPLTGSLMQSAGLSAFPRLIAAIQLIIFLSVLGILRAAGKTGSVKDLPADEREVF